MAKHLRFARDSDTMDSGGEATMWDATRQRRFERLREAQEQGTLSDMEGAELAALIEARCRAEEAAIRETAQRVEAGNGGLEAQVEQVQAQNQELEALIQEQEAYLAEVQAMIAGMQERRRGWRERYKKLTGRALGDSVTVPPGG